MGRNINNLRYADDTTLMAQSEEELMRLLMKVKEESENAGLKLNIQKTKILGSSSPITSWQVDGEIIETVTDFIFLGSKITADGDWSLGIKTLAPWKKSYDKSKVKSLSRVWLFFFFNYFYFFLFIYFFRVRLFAAPWTVAYQGPPSMEFSR